jgi:hypothetical protein
LNIIAIHGVFYQGQRPMDDSAADWGIQYPYVNDPERQTWETYELFSHPSYALINADGSLERKSAGIVATSETEEWLLQQLDS